MNGWESHYSRKRKREEKSQNHFLLEKKEEKKIDENDRGKKIEGINNEEKM